MQKQLDYWTESGYFNDQVNAMIEATENSPLANKALSIWKEMQEYDAKTESEKIALMKDSAVIINTARGELIETEALFDALLQKKISGAALDVLEFEETISNKRPCDKLNLKTLRTSLINTKLMNLDNTLITPHIAYDTKEAINRILEITLKNFIEFTNGKDIENKVT